MSQTGTRKLRPLLLSVLCLAIWHGAVSAPALAQRRVPSNAPPETPSQRWLPLPQGGSADLKQQVQWLQQLKGLVGSDSLGGETPSLPKFDPEQLKTLLEMMKQIKSGIPDGTQSPPLNGVTPEQVSKVLADPALREQARRLLEQFSRDGTLPQRGAATDTKSVPFPVNSPKRGTKANGESLERNPLASATGEESSAMPRAMQELLQRLAQQTGRQPNGLPPGRDPLGGGALEREPGADNRNSPSPDGQRMKLGDPPAIGRSPTNDAARASRERLGAETPRAGQGPRVDRKPGGRDSSDGVPQNDPNHVSRFPGADQQPAVTPPAGLSQQKIAEQILRDLTGETTAEPRLSPSQSQSVIEQLRNALDSSDRAGPDQPGPVNPRVERSAPHEAKPHDAHSASSLSNTRPSPSAVSNNGATNGSQPPRAGNRGSVPTGDPTSSRDRDPRGSALSPAPLLHQEPTPAEPLSGEARPRMDVRSELEEQGFAQTLRKIIEQAREESLVASNDSAGPSAGGRAVRDGSSTGLEGSVVRMLDGLRKDLLETGQEPVVPSPAPVQPQPSAVSPSAPQPVAEHRSPLSQMSKAAGSILSDIATPPASRPASVRSPHATSSGGTADSQGAGSRSMLSLLMLLAVLGLVWYFAPQLLAAINNSRLAGSPVGGEIHPADIRSRSDVVRAFHQYALRPATPAATWWTHREVARQVAQATPALQPAIQTLTDLYEQARYLPDDVDFTSDQIGTARRALEQCAACPSDE